MSNIQITSSANVNNARSESAVVVNPNNPQQLVASSKRFRDLHTYDFTLATSYSTDGGLTWHDSADFPMPSWTLLTDPALAWDDSGNVFMVGLPGNNPPAFDTIGIAIYKSTDGGQTWGEPNLIHNSGGDDKQWVAGDTNPASPFHGRVYAVWDDGSAMRFARTLNHGDTWIGVGASTIASGSLTGGSFSPEINVAANGDIYIVWIDSPEIKLIVSNDGGESFHAVTSPATGVTKLSTASLPSAGGWPVFPGGNFRVLTVPTACVFGQTVVVAWDDFREGVSRIYYALSHDGGGSWETGASGQPLLTSAIDANFQHFFPQIIAHPSGAIGCAYYEFGPKPTTPLIDLYLAQSLDAGATFVPFKVTDSACDPTVGAPWAHHTMGGGIDASVTFYGDYFGIDASYQGFYPVWTDTRTGIQELWTDIVPVKQCAFIVERSTLGQDEIDARRGQPGGPVVTDAFRVVVDGFTAGALGLTNSSQTLTVASPTAGMTIICTGNTSATGGYGAEIQRFTFHYNIDFGPTDTAFGFAGPTLTLTLNASTQGLNASAQIELIKQPNPFILHGDPPWLSIDLRVFSIEEGHSKFGVMMGPDATSAPTFIQQVIANLTAGHGSAGGQTFNNDLPVDQTANLFVYPRVGPMGLTGNRVFNFAVAKVHYIGLIGAANVRVFFRLFQAQTTSTEFHPSTTYRRAPTNPHGHPIPRAGIKGNEYVTIPCFATPRVNTTVDSMDEQTDDPFNVQTFEAEMGGAEVDRFFGCWLDINQPLKPNGDPNNVLPVHVPATDVDGPFNDLANPPKTIQEAIMRNPHQCLVAEIAFDPITIPSGKDAMNWDKLAQRNLAWSDIPNPGVDGSRRALDTFEIKPSPAGLPPDQTLDEMMIDWVDLPAGALATIYLPAVNIDEVLMRARGMYTTHGLVRVDSHTLQCQTGGITYVPIPKGTDINYAGLLSVDLPERVIRGQVFNVKVRQVTNAYGLKPAPPEPPPGVPAVLASVVPQGDKMQWRRVLGAFQLTIPVSTKAALLEDEERVLSVMKWIAEAIPTHNRWYPVFVRYLDYIGDRVSGFGGDPDEIVASPEGTGRRPKCDHKLRWLVPLLLAPLLVLIALAPLIWSAPLAAAGLVLVVAAAYYWYWRCKTSLCDLLGALILGVSVAYLVLGIIALFGYRSLGLLLMLAILGIVNALLLALAMFKRCCWRCAENREGH